jgi:hypothetical protein
MFVVLPAILVLDRWWPLLTAIFTGNTKTLKWDILDSGICEDKRDEWAPKQEPLKPIWQTTPEERQEELDRRRQEWRGQGESRSKTLLSILFEPPKYQPPPVIQPRPPQPRVRTELDDLVDEMYRELD